MQQPQHHNIEHCCFQFFFFRVRHIHKFYTFAHNVLNFLEQTCTSYRATFIWITQLQKCPTSSSHPQTITFYWENCFNINLVCWPLLAVLFNPFLFSAGCCFVVVNLSFSSVLGYESVCLGSSTLHCMASTYTGQLLPRSSYFSILQLWYDIYDLQWLWPHDANRLVIKHPYFVTSQNWE